MIIQGDSLRELEQMDDGIVDTCLTSPPYWGIRDYGIDDQIGLEPKPEDYIQILVRIFHEVKRILKPTGTLWLNLGDTYGGSCCGTADYRKEKSISRIKLYRDKVSPQQKMRPKSLLMLPERVAIALLDDGWTLRNKIVWHKPNAMPESVKDRLTNKWEVLYFFSKQKKYFFDLDAIRIPYKQGVTRWGGPVMKPAKKTKYSASEPKYYYHRINEARLWRNNLGKNPGDVLEIPTRPYPDAHFAVFPEEFCRLPILATCPEFVCAKCGKPRERIKAKRGELSRQRGTRKKKGKGYAGSASRRYRDDITENIYEQTGLTDCGCGAPFIPGTVLDPFCGAGTTCVVAKQLGRDYLGIEINPEYVEQAEKRIAQVAHQKTLDLETREGG